MADGRKRRQAKQARRDARLRKTRDRQSAEQDETPLLHEVRQALDGGQPMELLGLVSAVIQATSKQLTLRAKPDAESTPSIDALVGAFIDVQEPETTALLAVLSELLVDDDVLRARCRNAVQQRHNGLPNWLAGLGQAKVRRAVRMTDVFGDGDELLLDVQLVDGHELTCAVFIDHLKFSGVKDAFVLPGSLESVLTVAKANMTDSDATFADVGLADARAGLRRALDEPLSMLLLEPSDTWPGCRPLVRWLGQLMPDGGFPFYVPREDVEPELTKRFFESPVGQPYKREYRELLGACISEGTGDPLRWSADRLTQLLNEAAAADGYDIPVEVQLDLPDLLRAFIPFAHAESGIRKELTGEALAAIADYEDHYRVEVIDRAESLGDFDDDE